MSRLAFPFAVAPSGRIAGVDYGSEPHVRQMLELLVFTLVGERPMRPDFGSPVTQMLFAAGNGPVAAALEATVQAAITQWLGHVLILHDLDVAFDEAAAMLDIAITYETRAARTVGRLEIRKATT